MDNTSTAQPVANPRLEFERAIAEFAQAKAALKIAEKEVERARDNFFVARNRDADAERELSRAQRALVASMMP